MKSQMMKNRMMTIAVAALAVVALSVGLIRVETASDLRILAAVGAAARARRVVAAATSGVLALLAAEAELGDIHRAQNRDRRRRDGGGGADIGPSGTAGNIPMFSHLAEANYFQIHHTPADTVERITPKQAADNAATIAVMAYVIADLPWRLGSEK